jgi:hypothetical protein
LDVIREARQQANHKGGPAQAVQSCQRHLLKYELNAAEKGRMAATDFLKFGERTTQQITTAQHEKAQASVYTAIQSVRKQATRGGCT